MERLGLVDYGILHISPQITCDERGGGQRQQPVYTGIVVNNFIGKVLVVAPLEREHRRGVKVANGSG
jgi:hypothetical protein